MPGCSVSEKARLVGATWAVAVRLPAGVCQHSFAAGMVAEGLPCEPGRADGVVYLPLCPSYSAEDAEHLVLGVAKVAHYLMETGQGLAFDTSGEGRSASASMPARGGDGSG